MKPSSNGTCPPAAEQTASQARPAAVTVVDSRKLFRNGTTLCIDHAGQRYILRVTRENKLILTK